MPSHPPSRDRFLHHFLESEVALRGFIASVMARPADREDMLQEVALRLWQLFERYDASRPFTAWALGVAARRMKEESRKAQRRPLLMDTSTIEQLASAFEQMAAETVTEEQAALERCLHALPEVSASLIQARYFQHQSIDALSATTGQTTAAIYQSLCRLRRRLANCIRQRLRRENPALSSASHVL
jgi:RNA polymerase sigma-70 factor (ECF subfamily)